MTTANSNTIANSVEPTLDSTNDRAIDQVEFSLLKAELLQLSMATASPELVRQRFRELAIQHSDGIGVCHAIRNGDGDWSVNSNHRTGRTPDRNDFAEFLGDISEQVFARNFAQVKTLDHPKGCQTLIMPVSVFGMKPEVFILLLSENSSVARPLMVLRAVVETLSLWLKGQAKSQDDWKLSSLAAIIELVSKVEGCDTVEESAELIANEVGRQIGVDVAVGLYDRRRPLVAISGLNRIDHNSETALYYSQVVHESNLRNKPGLWPAPNEDGDELLLAHKQLAARGQIDCVRTQPLIGLEGRAIGVVIVAGSEEAVGVERVGRFLLASGPRLASAIACVERTRQPAFIRAFTTIPRALRRKKMTVLFALMLGVVALMFLPVTYKVRCNAVVEPQEKRFAVAPFDGLVEEGLVEAGDLVEEGQLLACLDGRAIRWELAGLTAERQAAKKRRDIELVDQNVSSAMLQTLEQKRLVAKENVLNHQAQSLEIRSPIDGVVLSGSRDRAESTSVSTGDLLFEIAPLDSLKIEIEIPSEEVAQVDEGMAVTIWIEGREQEPIVGVLTRLHPRSEMRNAANVFVAEVEVPKEVANLRPGMKASARIDCRKRPLGWNLFHKPYNYLAANWFSW